MAIIKSAYAAKATITITLTSLANGSGRESTVVDNTGNLYLDVLVRVTTNGLAGGTKTLDLYVYTALGDTTYTDGATGTDAAFTAANRLNANFARAVVMNAATQVKGTMFSVALAFGGSMPDKWGLIAINNSGAALSATAGDHVLEFEGLTQTVT